MKSLVMALGLIALNSSAQAFDGRWPPTEKCPQSRDHFAIVVERVSGTNNSLYCKLITGENYKHQNDPSMKVTDYIDCVNSPLEINTLVLITEGYHAVLDHLGNERCMSSVALVKVIGKVSY